MIKYHKATRIYHKNCICVQNGIHDSRPLCNIGKNVQQEFNAIFYFPKLSTWFGQQTIEASRSVAWQTLRDYGNDKSFRILDTRTQNVLCTKKWSFALRISSVNARFPTGVEKLWGRGLRGRGCTPLCSREGS